MIISNQSIESGAIGPLEMHTANINDTLDTIPIDDLVSSIENRPVSTLSIVFAILFSFTFLFGIFTNSIVVLVFAIKSEFRQYTNYFFANLSIADILVLLVCIPVAITDLFSPDIWNYGALYCKYTAAFLFNNQSHFFTSSIIFFLSS